MKKLLLIPAFAAFLFANQTETQILQKEINSQIIPQIKESLDKDGESVIILRVTKSSNGLLIQSYNVKKGFSKFVPFETKGDYNVGFKYYSKYIFKPAKIKVTDFIKIIGAKNDKDLDKLFANNGELLIKKLEEEKQVYAVKGLKSIIQKGKLNDLKEFLKGVLGGKVPASCS
ncbi:hypothetical protein [Caminibacter pacificus]|jgi:hypothetical protein